MWDIVSRATHESLPSSRQATPQGGKPSTWAASNISDSGGGGGGASSGYTGYAEMAAAATNGGFSEELPEPTSGLFLQAGTAISPLALLQGGFDPAVLASGPPAGKSSKPIL